ncbi:hypothetical protein HDV00_012130 [Rhizophlyctis rosea]|nr:hypothetical protein HDV00_012130 [Rhizophlyctis rosea]
MLSTKLEDPFAIEAIDLEVSSNPLSEDWHLRGFTPFKTIYGRLHYGKITGSGTNFCDAVDGVVKREQLWLQGDELADVKAKETRGRRVLFFAKSFAETSKILGYDAERRSFSSSKPSIFKASNLPDTTHVSDSEEELEYEPYDFEKLKLDNAIDFGEPVEQDGGDVAELMSRRQELHGTISARKRTVADQYPSAKPKRVNAPKIKEGVTVLVFDTNFWLNNFDGLRRIIDSGKWIVSVPLVVIAELGGLARSASQREELANSPAVLKYLETEFDQNLDPRKRKKWLKLQTSQGNFLPALTVRTESWDSKANDDVILRCCQHFRGKQKLEQEDGWSEVVLFTDDVNLRLKARATGVDVSARIEDLEKSLK